MEVSDLSSDPALPCEMLRSQHEEVWFMPTVPPEGQFYSLGGKSISPPPVLSLQTIPEVQCISMQAKGLALIPLYCLY